jgi:hypothetical protein
MINKGCGLSDRQRFYVIMHKECLWPMINKNCDDCEYLDFEKFCAYATADGCQWAQSGQPIPCKYSVGCCEFLQMEKMRQRLG